MTTGKALELALLYNFVTELTSLIVVADDNFTLDGLDGDLAVDESDITFFGSRKSNYAIYYLEISESLTSVFTLIIRHIPCKVSGQYILPRCIRIDFTYLKKFPFGGWGWTDTDIDQCPLCFLSHLLTGNSGLGVVSGGPNAGVITGLVIAVLFILASLGMHNEFSNP